MKTIYQDIFLYFARFADKSGVLKNFNNKPSSDEDYIRFYSAAEQLPDKPLIPGIPDFLLGASEDSVKKRILTFKSTYLFVDYGEVSSHQNELKVQEDEFRLGITVARPLSVNSYNLPEEIILNDRLLNTILAIRQYMKDDRSDPFIRRLTFPQELQPFNAPELSNSYGWTMIFTMRGVAMI